MLNILFGLSIEMSASLHSYSTINFTDLPSEVLLHQLAETGGKIIICFQNTAKHFIGKTDNEIIIIPDGETKGANAENIFCFNILQIR